MKDEATGRLYSRVRSVHGASHRCSSPSVVWAQPHHSLDVHRRFSAMKKKPERLPGRRLPVHDPSRYVIVVAPQRGRKDRAQGQVLMPFS